MKKTARELPLSWAAEHPSLRAVVPAGPVSMVGEDWYAPLFSDSGQHRYRAELPFRESSFDESESAGRLVGVDWRWNRRLARLRASGHGWMAEVARVQSRYLDDVVRIMVEFTCDRVAAQAGARHLIARVPALAPFLSLVEERGFELLAGVHLHHPGREDLGYLEMGGEEMSEFVASHLASWMCARGFRRVVDASTHYRLGDSEVHITWLDFHPTGLRIDLATFDPVAAV
jgi:hypothetical protein